MGFRVLERRAFDAHRDDVRRWANEPLHLEAEEVEAPEGGPEKTVEYAQLLKALLDLLTGLAKSDRELILRDELFGGSMSRLRSHRRSGSD